MSSIFYIYLIYKKTPGWCRTIRAPGSLASEAQVILADEPTGNLDEDTAAEITSILKNSAHQVGKCVVVFSMGVR